MKYLFTALLLVSLGVMARSEGQQKAHPNGPAPPNQQAADAAMMQASASNAHDTLLEGCVEGPRDNLTLTDAAGKVYLLRGETVRLADHIGQYVSITGTETRASAQGAAGARPAFTVKKVMIIGRVCSASK